MLQALVITFREGVEAFLVVAISLAYLRKTGRDELCTAVYWGVASSILTSGIAGYLFSLASNQSLWEGILATLAAVLVGSLVAHMWRAARGIKNRIHARLNAAAAEGFPRQAWWGVFLFIVLMVTREGMETALLLGTLLFQMKTPQILSGALLGIFAAAILAFLWSRYGHLVNLRRFLQVTAIFLFVFVLQLLIYGVHELAEANFLPHSVAIHDATEPYGPDGIFGRWLSLGLVAVPLGWLLISYLGDLSVRGKKPGTPATPAVNGARP